VVVEATENQCPLVAASDPCQESAVAGLSVEFAEFLVLSDRSVFEFGFPDFDLP
jgi:hypothetical protein